MSILSLTLAMSISGCTVWVWTDATQDTTKQKTITLDKDKVVAFGQVQQNHPQLAKDSLVMMGEKYWYTFSPEKSKEFFSYLRADLPRAYDVNFNPTHNFGGQATKNAFLVNVEDNGKFWSHFCLSYTLDKDKKIAEKESVQLQKLGFNSDKITGKVKVSLTGENISNYQGTSNYSKCLHINGKYFKARSDTKIEYKFQQPLPVALQKNITERKKGLNTFEQILLTPLSLAADVVIIPTFALCVAADIPACRINLIK